MSTIEQAKKKRAELHATLKGDISVHGTSIKFDITTNSWSIMIHSTKPHELDGKNLGEFKISNVVHEPMEPCGDRNKYRPLKGGCQIETSEGYGTLGYFAKIEGEDEYYFLTNQHVLPSGYAFQADHNAGNLIGECTYAVLNPYVDAAIGLLKPGLSIDPQVIAVGQIEGSHKITEKEVEKGDCFVQKFGRTTDLTTGKVTSIDFHGTRTDGWSFSKQLFVEADYEFFSQSGDSGSLVVNADSNAVGLLWGDSGKFSGVSPIDYVTQALGIDLL